MTDHNTNTKVVVIGGGYAGTLAANRLQQNTCIDITLVNPRPKFVQPDREILEQPGVLETLIASLTEAFREGYRGAALDGTLLAGRLGHLRVRPT